MVGVVFFEYVVDCLLNLVSGITQLMIFLVGLVLHELAVESREGLLVLRERRTGTLGIGRDRSQVRHVFGFEANEPSGVGRQLLLLGRTLLGLLGIGGFDLGLAARGLHPL